MLLILTPIFAAFAVLHPPVGDLQGNWHVYKMKVREAGEQDWHTLTFSWPVGPHWTVRGTRIESTFYESKTSKFLSAGSVGEGPSGVRFVDHDGVAYTGSYALNKDGTVVLDLCGWAPRWRDWRTRSGTGTWSSTSNRPRNDP